MFVDLVYRYEKGAYMFGRLDMCDFVLEHPTISRFHAGMYAINYYYFLLLISCIHLLGMKLAMNHGHILDTDI